MLVIKLNISLYYPVIVTYYTKKQLPKRKLFSLKKIVAGLSQSVYRFYEPFIFSDVHVCKKQTYHRNQWKNRLNTLLRNRDSSG